MAKKLISIVIPAYNEEECIEKLQAELVKTFDALSAQYDFETIIVENGSQDNTYAKLQAAHAKDPRFKIVKLTRNFTCDGGISAGLYYASGAAAIIMYADMQEQPSLIVAFLEKWERGYLNVYGIIEERKDVNVVRTVNSKIFYWILETLTAGTIPRNVGDFRLVDKSLYQAINSMPERNRILRGLFAWTGAKSIGVPYKRQGRVGGKSKSNTWYALQFAMRAIFSFSYFPVTLITILGVLLSAGSFVTIVLWSIKFMLWGVPFDGYGTIIGLMLLLFGFAFIMIGIIGKYIAMIYEEVKQRPNYIVSETRGFTSSNIA